MKHGWELAALWSLAVIVIIGSIFVAGLGDFGIAILGDKAPDNSQTHGIVIGGLMAALPLLINSIRNIGQSQAMQSMVNQLGKSAPVQEQPIVMAAAPAPADAVEAAQETADAAHAKADKIAQAEGPKPEGDGT